MNRRIPTKVVMYILNEIFSHASATQVAEIDKIYSEHKLLVEDSFNGFSYKGAHYLQAKAYYQGTKPLHPSLRNRMAAYIKQCQNLSSERNYITSYLQAVFNNCESLGQCYQMIPTGLHQILVKQHITRDDNPIKDVDQITRYNQKGYDLLLQRILLNTVGC